MIPAWVTSYNIRVQGARKEPPMIIGVVLRSKMKEIIITFIPKPRIWNMDWGRNINCKFR